MSRRTLGLCCLLLLGIGVTGGMVAAGEPPLADAGLDQRVDRGATVLLDGTGSWAPGGRLTDYEWTIQAPDGSTVTPADADAPRTRFVARQRGRYVVTLTVTDDEGRTATDRLYVDVGRTEASGTPAPTTPANTPTPTPTDDEGTTPSTPTRDRVVDTPEDEPPETVSTPDAPVSDVGTEDEESGSTGDGGDGGTTGTTTVDCPPGSYLPLFGCIEPPDPDTPAAARIAGDRYVTQGAVRQYRVEIRDDEPGDERVEWNSALASGGSISRVFTEEPGTTVPLSATVHDGEGHETTISTTVHVIDDRTNEPPRVKIQGPQRACTGQEVTLDGIATASEHRDRVVDTTWHDPPKFVPQAPGRYDVKFSATDTKGQTAETIHSVFVYGEGECQQNAGYTTSRLGSTDKLVIDAEDDNFEVGGDSAPLANALGKSLDQPDDPVDAAIEGGQDIGKAVATGAESTVYESVVGNRETIRREISHDAAMRIQDRVGPKDEPFGDADGPRINEFEQLRGATIRDPVETSEGKVQLVVRIGKENHGEQDAISSALQDLDMRQAKTKSKKARDKVNSKDGSPPDISEGGIDQSEISSGTTDRGSESITSTGETEEQTEVDQNRSPADSVRNAVDETVDVVNNAVEQVTDPLNVDVPEVGGEEASSDSGSETTEPDTGDESDPPEPDSGDTSSSNSGGSGGDPGGQDSSRGDNSGSDDTSDGSSGLVDSIQSGLNDLTGGGGGTTDDNNDDGSDSEGGSDSGGGGPVIDGSSSAWSGIL